MLAKGLRRPGSLADGSVGALISQKKKKNVTTEFGFKFRMSMQKAFVRNAAAMLRKAKPLYKTWSVGDFSMNQVRANA